MKSILPNTICDPKGNPDIERKLSMLRDEPKRLTDQRKQKRVKASSLTGQIAPRVVSRHARCEDSEVLSYLLPK